MTSNVQNMISKEDANKLGLFSAIKKGSVVPNIFIDSDTIVHPVLLNRTDDLMIETTIVF